MTTRDEWVGYCLRWAAEPAEFFSGARKILTGRSMELSTLDDSLQLEHAGFTRNKLAMLRRLYYSEEHCEAVVPLWNRRLEQAKYGSVGVSTYHHITKADPLKRSVRASVMGPCLLGVTLTLLPDRSTAVDMFYRTTELFKKFPADLVFLRDVLLPHYRIDRLARVRCHFAGVTLHPMYFVTLVPSLHDPCEALDSIRPDRRFYEWTVKWTARYVCDEYMRGIAKFAQAMRVRKDALERVDDLAALQKYVRENHPGYRNQYEEPDDDEE